MAKSYIHELGDRLSNGFTADNLPKHIKEIAPIMYNDGSNNFNSIQSALNGKADKVSGATNGNLAALDSNGNLTDSGKKASDFEMVNNKVSAWQGTPDNTHYPSEKLVKDALDKKASAYNFVAAYSVKAIQLRYPTAGAMYDGHFVTIMTGYGGISYRNITFSIRKDTSGAPTIHRYNTEISSGDHGISKNFDVYYGADPSDANYGILRIIPKVSINGLLQFCSITSAQWSTYQSTLDTEGLTALNPVEHTNVFGAGKGSASVPVYVGASGEATPCTDTFVNQIEYVANQSGGGGNLNKTINGKSTSVLTFMNDSEAIAIWNDAKTAAANAS